MDDNWLFEVRLKIYKIPIFQILQGLEFNVDQQREPPKPNEATYDPQLSLKKTVTPNAEKTIYLGIK